MVSVIRIYVKNADFGDVSGCTLGHEGGIVTEVGKDVTSLKLVIVHLLHGFMKAAGIANIVLLVEKRFVVQ